MLALFSPFSAKQERLALALQKVEKVIDLSGGYRNWFP